jgi:hypothetical protein
MNRRERREAKAQSRRTGYMHRLNPLLVAHRILGQGVSYARIEHDADCGHYRGIGCTCVPNISISTAGGGIVLVDEDGAIRKVAKQ